MYLSSPPADTIVLASALQQAKRVAAEICDGIRPVLVTNEHEAH